MMSEPLLNHPMAADTPRLQSRELDVDASYINGCTGLDLEATKMAELLSRMALSAEASSDGSSVHVRVPPTRSDVLHPCDVMEVGAPLLSRAS